MQGVDAVGGVVLDPVDAVADVEDVGVVAGPALQDVIASAARQDVVGIVADHGLACILGIELAQLDGVDVPHRAVGELDAVDQRVAAELRMHRDPAAVGQFDDQVAVAGIRAPQEKIIRRNTGAKAQRVEPVGRAPDLVAAIT